MSLSVNGQRIENADSVELNSGGASNPSIETGTDDPSSIGKAAAEGSIYLRYVANTGELYVKTDVADTAWTLAVVGTSSVSLDQAYDTGDTITADTGPVQINNAVVDTSSCLKMTRIPGSSAASSVLDIDSGANSTGNAVDVLVGNTAASALVVGNSAVSTVPIVSLSASAGLGASGSILSLSASAAGNATGHGIDVTMDVNQSGNAINISHAGSGKAIVADNDVDITGVLKLNGAQHTTIITLADAASITTNASLGNLFTVTIGGNRTLANPSSLDDGTYIWVITQDATGSRTLAYDTMFKFPGGITPVLSTAANSVDVLTAIYDGTNLLTTFQADFS